MKWGFTLQNKLKMALLLLVVFAGLLIRNLVDKRHDAELGKSFNSVYKDRLLVEGYIYELSNCLHAKKEWSTRSYAPEWSAAAAKEMDRQNARINELVTAYERTKLTEKEAVTLAALKNRLRTIDQFGRSYLDRLQYAYPVDDLQTEMCAVIDKASGDLQQLSAIQLAVGKDMNDDSQKILSESAVLSQFAAVLLIVIGLVIQGLIFQSEERIKKLPDVRLN